MTIGLDRTAVDVFDAVAASPSAAGIPTSVGDAEVILGDALEMGRSDVRSGALNGAISTVE